MMQGRDNIAVEMDEEGDARLYRADNPNHLVTQNMDDIVLEDPVQQEVHIDEIKAERESFNLRPPMLTSPSSSEDQALRKAAQIVAEEKCGCNAVTYWKRSRIRGYYKNQVELLDSYEKDRLETGVDQVDSTQNSDADVKSRHQDANVAKIVFTVNVCLLLTKLVASYLSGSLSVISTVLDSVMDLTSGAVVWVTMRAIKNSNPYRYPRGRTRLEPIAIIIVSIVMGIGNILIVFESVSLVISDTINPRMSLSTVALVLGVIVVKAVLYWLCARRHTSNCDVLAMDQRNDVVSNFIALVGALVGTYLWRFADPLGAIGVCTFIAVNWFRTTFKQVDLLSGETAKPDMINRIIKLGIDHDERIKCLDMVLAYHFGNDFLVEMHIVLDETMNTHRNVHDISESLQYKLERLPFVERAFLHCDWEAGDDYELYKNNIGFKKA